MISRAADKKIDMQILLDMHIYFGGLWGTRTLDIMVVTHALSQLS